MFVFLSILSYIQCFLSFILLGIPDLPSIVAIFCLISGIINIVVYRKLAIMEKRTQWLTDIAKEKGYKDPTEPTPTDIYSGDQKDGE